MDFSCTKCGACCRRLRLFGRMYAWLVDEDSGMCRYFEPQTNLCSIYPIRPLMCNLEKGYKVYYGHMTWDEFVKKNLEACELLKNLPDSLP